MEVKLSNKKMIGWSVVITLCALSWGGIHPSLKSVLNSGMAPFLAAFLRFFIASLTTLPFCLKKSEGRKMLVFRDAAVMAVLGLYGVGFFSLLLSFGLSYTNATSSSILINSQPVFTVFLAAVLLKDKIKTRPLLGLILGCFGIIMVVTRGDFTSLSFADDYLIGNLMCLAGAFFISLHYVYLKKYINIYGSTIPSLITSVSGAIVLLFAAIAGGADFRSLADVSPVSWLQMLYIGVIATGLSNIIFNKALHVIGITKAIGFKFLVPVFGVVLSIILLGERANLWVYLGIAVVLAAIMFIQIPGKAKKNG